MDGTSAHEKEDPPPELNSTEVYCLPLNTTSEIQPMNAGIIASMKVKCRKLQMENALGKVDAGATNIYKGDVLTAMQYMKEERRVLSPSVISNCWRHASILNIIWTSEQSNTGCSICDASSADNVIQDVSGHIGSIVLAHARISISNVLNVEEEGNVMQE